MGKAGIELDYEAQLKPRLPREQRVYLAIMKCLALYCVVCTVTIPFVDSLWVGEVPVLALIQLPKIEPAQSLRRRMVRMLWEMGYSASFSPSYTLVRPYALAIVYIVPLTLLALVVGVRTRLARPHGWWLCALLLAAGIDYLITLVFADGRGLTIY